ncbi:MAG: tRNA (adenosine(37)-N6)-threonylcarbamoyltransferase complex dimerization subunit type 1 TsaB [Gemmobacter sp.]|nr:tRNA (adenosine(37)-N6)-threonylcarbamoyltransferase complex dimerization subunit type 1 TsaB [Gemmobacter sp.]
MRTSGAHILAFDTSAAHCAAALVWQGDRIRIRRTEAMAKGQAERLIPLLEEVLTEAGIGWRDLGALAVGIGPGNFTGVRIAVSAARGLALGLGVPAVGVSSFEAMRAADALGGHAHEIVSLPAPHDMAYVQHFRFGTPQAAPRMIDPEAPPYDLELPVDMRVRGFRAAQIARAFHAQADETALDDIAARIGDVARWRLSLGEQPRRPAPLYVRPADAAPPSDHPPAILDAIAP